MSNEVTLTKQQVAPHCLQTIIHSFSKPSRLIAYRQSFIHSASLHVNAANTIVEDFTTPRTRRYTTLWHTNFQKLHQTMQSNTELSAHKLQKM